MGDREETTYSMDSAGTYTISYGGEVVDEWESNGCMEEDIGVCGDCERCVRNKRLERIRKKTEAVPAREEDDGEEYNVEVFLEFPSNEEARAAGVRIKCWREPGVDYSSRPAPWNDPGWLGHIYDKAGIEDENRYSLKHMKGSMSGVKTEGSKVTVYLKGLRYPSRDALNAIVDKNFPTARVSTFLCTEADVVWKEK